MALPLRSNPLRALAPDRERGRARRRAVLERNGRPALVVVTPRRRFAWFAITLTVLVTGSMIGAVLLHTRIAERQLEIDRLERGVHAAQEQFDVLRASRAELRAPTRLAAEGTGLGMVPGAESTFVTVDPWTLARTIARTGELPASDVLAGDRGSETSVRLEPLDQFRLVKEVSAELP